uniref:Uncharacterized protein n=1 Tax=Glossina palpalis gambiensis TaxID=67801 RepID=A0A1B0AL06_9MUSC
FVKVTIRLRLHLKFQQTLLVRAKIKDVPQLKLRMKSPMRRFITLFDIFYDNHIRVVISADVSLDKLFMAFTQHFFSFSSSGASSSDLGKNAVSSCIPAFSASSTFNTNDAAVNVFTGEEEFFAFDRTISCLYEIQSKVYWEKWAKPH